FSLDMLPAPPASTPSPYTPLFRSGPCALAPARRHVLARSTARHSRNGAPGNRSNALRARPEPRPDGRAQAPPSRRLRGTDPRARSEEHTSELQSRENLVCRLLLEK